MNHGPAMTTNNARPRTRFIAVSKANPEFAHFFFIHEHVERFLTTEHRREGPVWYFVPIVVAGSLPWLTLLPKALVDGWREPPRRGFAPMRLLIAYLAVVFVFFSLSGSKLPSYVLPMFPALAILVGRRLATIDARAFARHLGFVLCVALVVAVAVHLVPLDSNDSGELVARFRTAASVCMGVWFVGTAVALWLATRKRMGTAVVAAGCAAVVAWSSLLWSHEILGRGMSTYDLAREMTPWIAPDTTIYSVGTFEHTLDFYLQRTVTLVAFEDELAFGLAQEPAKGVPYARFAARWKADRAPLAIMAEDVFATLTAARLPMRIVARDGRRIVVAKPPAQP